VSEPGDSDGARAHFAPFSQTLNSRSSTQIVSIWRLVSADLLERDRLPVSNTVQTVEPWTVGSGFIVFSKEGQSEVPA
jgi:hypothetical protein